MKYLTILLILLSIESKAMRPPFPPMGGSPFPCGHPLNPPPCAIPLDKEIGFLIGAGILLGIRKIKHKK